VFHSSQHPIHEFLSHFRSTDGYHAPQDFEFVCAAECTPSMVRARRTLVLAFAFMASTAGHPFANLIRSACDASHVVNATSALGSFPMSTRTPDFVSSRIKRDGFWEIRHPDEMMRLADSVAPRGDGVFIDIGANIGWYSFLFAQFGYKVYAIEAMPANQKAIQATMCLNPQLAQKITLIPSAIGTGERRPVVRGNDIVIEQQMTITLSTDHRCIDGALGAEFIGAIKAHLEEPGLMLV
jgi:hypothetical protein